MQQRARRNILIIAFDNERTQPHLEVTRMVCIDDDVKLFDGASLHIGDDVLR